MVGKDTCFFENDQFVFDTLCWNYIFLFVSFQHEQWRKGYAIWNALNRTTLALLRVHVIVPQTLSVY